MFRSLFRPNRILIAVLALAAAAILGPAPALADTVKLPIRLDYPLLRSLFIHKIYTAPGQRALVLDADEGCSRIEMWEPSLVPEGRYSLRELAAASNTKSLKHVEIEGVGEAWDIGLKAPDGKFSYTVTIVPKKSHEIGKITTGPGAE